MSVKKQFIIQNKKRVLLLTVALPLSLPVQAVNFTDPIDDQFDMGSYLADNAYGFLPVPIVITEPAIGYGGGIAGVFLHESDEQKKKRQELAKKSLNGGAQLLTPAITAAGGLATENGTWLFFAGHRRTWKQDSIRYLVGGGYGNINMTFYSQRDPNQSKGAKITIDGYGLKQKLQFRVDDTPIFLGVSQEFASSDLEAKDNANINSIIGDFINLSPNISGLGLIAEYDSKNNLLFPTDGYEYTAEYMWFRDGIGSDYDYETLAIAGTNYWPLAKEWTLIVKGEYESITTNERRLPVFTYPDINMRGIPRNRYQGNYTVTAQSQLMWQFTPRWLTSVFGGVGSATESGGDLFSENSNYAYGVGFRYMIARRYGLHSGVDIAFSEEDNALYFNLGTGL